MASIDRTDVTASIEALRLLGNDEFDLSLEHEVCTDKDRVKLVPCRVCRRPMVVTNVFAPAKAQCRACKGDTPDAHVASVGQPIPGQTDPAKAVNLADCLINQHFANVVCPAHPDDPEHEMELKSVTHNDHHGPGQWTAKREWRQIAKGETAMHQCLKCNATTTLSTVPVIQYRRQNEAKEAPDFGAPHRGSLLGVRGPDPTASGVKRVAA